MGFFGPYVAAEVKIGRLASPSLSRKPHQVYCLCFDTIGSEFQHNCFLESVSGSTLAKASLIDAICIAVHLFWEYPSLSLSLSLITPSPISNLFTEGPPIRWSLDCLLRCYG